MLDILGSRALVYVRSPRASGTRTVEMRDGTLLTYRLNRGDVQAFREIWLDQAYRLPSEAQNLRRVVDLGANIGFTSVYLARALQPTALLAVEPDPDNARLVRRNLAQNGIEATVLEAAVGPVDGSCSFSRDDSSNLGRIAADGELTVDVVSIPTAMAQLNGAAGGTLLKLDIEGGEEALFAGELSWLGEFECVLAELHPAAADIERIMALLEDAGLRFQPGTPGGPPAHWMRNATA